MIILTVFLSANEIQAKVNKISVFCSRFWSCFEISYPGTHYPSALAS
jgi:hypothetical protein